MFHVPFFPTCSELNGHDLREVKLRIADEGRSRTWDMEVSTFVSHLLHFHVGVYVDVTRRGQC